MKRIFDIVGASFGLVLLSPLIVVVAVFVRWQMGSPIMFRQTRPGFRGKPFEILKFRTMRNSIAPSEHQQADDERLDRFGRALRSSSLDELPELWNVVKGEMSLVGPRPLLMDYLLLYNDRQNKRHEVRPGITGWAQVNGRNAIDWDEKLELDVWYVENRSFLLDLKILLLTIPTVIRRDGINARGHATQARFRGKVRSDNASKSNGKCPKNF